MRPNAKKVASGVDVMQIFVPKSREEIAKFPEIRRAARTKMRAFGQQPLRMLQNFAGVDRVDNAFHIEKARVRRRDHANVAPKSREKIANFLKIFGAPRAQKNSMHSTCVRCNSPVMFEALYEVINALRSEHARVRR